MKVISANISMALAKTADGNFGTKPVWTKSNTTGIDIAIPVNDNITADNEKNNSGL